MFNYFSENCCVLQCLQYSNHILLTFSSNKGFLKIVLHRKWGFQPRTEMFPMIYRGQCTKQKLENYTWSYSYYKRKYKGLKVSAYNFLGKILILIPNLTKWNDCAFFQTFLSFLSPLGNTTCGFFTSETLVWHIHCCMKFSRNADKTASVTTWSFHLIGKYSFCYYCKTNIWPFSICEALVTYRLLNQAQYDVLMLDSNVFELNKLEEEAWLFTLIPPCKGIITVTILST